MKEIDRDLSASDKELAVAEANRIFADVKDSKPRYPLLQSLGKKLNNHNAVLGVAGCLVGFIGGGLFMTQVAQCSAAEADIFWRNTAKASYFTIGGTCGSLCGLYFGRLGSCIAGSFLEKIGR